MRGSNTEPLIKVIVESKDIESFRTKKEDILSALETKMESFGLSLKLVEAKNA